MDTSGKGASLLAFGGVRAPRLKCLGPSSQTSLDVTAQQVVVTNHDEQPAFPELTALPTGAKSTGNKRRGLPRGVEAAAEGVRSPLAELSSPQEQQKQHAANVAAAAGAKSGRKSAVHDAVYGGNRNQSSERDLDEISGQEVFNRMQRLAEQVERVVPQEEPEKKRARGRQKKEPTLMEALHKSWQGKVGGKPTPADSLQQCTGPLCVV